MASKHCIKLLLLLFCCFSIATVSMAQDQRRLCKKFWPNVSTEKCINLQESGRKRLSNGTYYPQVVQSCLSQTDIVDRKAVYKNYYQADKCAIKEQARIVAEEESKAYTKRNKAQAKYYNEAAKSKRKYRDKYLD